MESSVIVWRSNSCRVGHIITFSFISHIQFIPFQVHYILSGGCSSCPLPVVVCIGQQLTPAFINQCINHLRRCLSVIQRACCIQKHTRTKCQCRTTCRTNNILYVACVVQHRSRLHQFLSNVIYTFIIRISRISDIIILFRIIHSFIRNNGHWTKRTNQHPIEICTQEMSLSFHVSNLSFSKLFISIHIMNENGNVTNRLIGGLPYIQTISTT